MYSQSFDRAVDGALEPDDTTLYLRQLLPRWSRPMTDLSHAVWRKARRGVSTTADAWRWLPTSAKWSRSATVSTPRAALTSWAGPRSRPSSPMRGGGASTWSRPPADLPESARAATRGSSPRRPPLIVGPQAAVHEPGRARQQPRRLGLEHPRRLLPGPVRGRQRCREPGVGEQELRATRGPANCAVRTPPGRPRPGRPPRSARAPAPATAGRRGPGRPGPRSAPAGPVRRRRHRPATGPRAAAPPSSGGQPPPTKAG